MLPYVIMDLPIFLIAEWGTLLVDIRCTEVVFYLAFPSIFED